MKQYIRYRMDFESSWLRWSATFAGVPIVLLVFYYLGMQYLTSPGSLFFDLWLPVGLSLVYIVALRGIRFNAPGVYAIWGAVVCLYLLIGACTSGSVLRILLGIPAYVICGGVLILCVGGFLPGRLPAAVCFGVVLAARILFFDVGRISGADWLPELADLGLIASLMCLPLGTVPGKK